ncbi:MAG: succinate--CoA ligase subunit alpha [Candidatus Sumerlaeia bacterium]|nr:succinate--CoA ligase subunit alpha [Candidatus Sumerlaeia bacterium]
MSILVDDSTRLVIQGITGREGLFHGEQMKAYGTKLVAGVTPGKGGQTVLDGVPVFNTVRESVEKAGANTSIIYVPAKFAKDAALEAIESGVRLFILITEGIPTLEMMQVYHEAKRAGVRFIGPNCPGVITPGQAKCGIMPGHIHKPGRVGLISRSGTLTYEVVWEMTQAGIGQSTCVGIGGDPIIGTTHRDALMLFEDDPETDAVILIGEIGGSDEEEAARFARDHMTKPVVGFIAGLTAPEGKRMGHAGAIISGGKGTAQEKLRIMRECGIRTAERPDQIVGLVQEALAGKMAGAR